MKTKTIKTKEAIGLAADYITIRDIDFFLFVINAAAECNKEHAQRRDGIYRSLKEMLEHMIDMYNNGDLDKEFPKEQVMIYLDMLPEELLKSYIK